MTTPPPTGETSADRVAAALDDIVGSVDRGLESAGKLLSGTYTADDAAADVAVSTAKLVDVAKDLLLCWAALTKSLVSSGPTPEIPGKGPVTVDLPGPLAKAVTPQARPFRAIGWPPHFTIDASAVTFPNAVVGPNRSMTIRQGATTFEVDVISDLVHPDARKRTIVFEGVVVDAQTREPLCDPIRFVRPADPHP